MRDTYKDIIRNRNDKIAHVRELAELLSQESHPGVAVVRKAIEVSKDPHFLVEVATMLLNAAQLDTAQPRSNG
jgi:hypothetical protein